MRTLILILSLVLTGCEVTPLAPPVEDVPVTAGGGGEAKRDDRIIGRWSLGWGLATGQPDGEIVVIAWHTDRYRVDVPASGQVSDVVWVPAESRWAWSYRGAGGQTMRMRFAVPASPDQLDGTFSYTTKAGTVSGIVPMHRVPGGAG